MDDLLKTQPVAKRDYLEGFTESELILLIEFAELPVFNVIRKMQKTKRDHLLDDVMKMRNNISGEFIIREIAKIQGEYRNTEEILKISELAKSSLAIRNKKQNGQANTNN